MYSLKNLTNISTKSYNPVIEEKVLTDNILSDIKINLSNIENIKETLSELLQKWENPIYDENDHEIKMLSISKSNLDIYSNEQETEWYINYESEIIATDIKNLINIYKNYLFKIITLIWSSFDLLGYKTLDDYCYSFKLKTDKIIEKNNSIYVLSWLSNNDIKVNPYKLINKIYKNKYEYLVSLYEDINDEDNWLSIKEQVNNIVENILPDENIFEYLYNWENHIEENEIIELKDFSIESKNKLKEIELITDREQKNLKREEILYYFASNLEFHIEELISELNLSELINNTCNENKKYNWLFSQLYKIVTNKNNNNFKYNLLLNILKEYINISDWLSFTEDVRKGWKNIMRISGKWYTGVLYLPTFNWIDNLLKKIEKN